MRAPEAPETAEGAETGAAGTGDGATDDAATALTGGDTTGADAGVAAGITGRGCDTCGGAARANSSG